MRTNGEAFSPNRGLPVKHQCRHTTPDGWQRCVVSKEETLDRSSCLSALSLMCKVRHLATPA